MREAYEVPHVFDQDMLSLLGEARVGSCYAMWSKGRSLLMGEGRNLLSVARSGAGNSG